MFLDNRHRGRDYTGGWRFDAAFIFLNVSAIFMVACFYALNRFWLKPHIGGVFLSGYFNDLLAGAAILAIANVLWELTPFAPGRPFTRFQWALVTVVPAGLFWEYVTPLYRLSSVSDPYDLLAYLIGGLVFWSLIRIMRIAPETSPKRLDGHPRQRFLDAEKISDGGTNVGESGSNP